jgi:ABC-type dipeptide/oligopeptide/nickel transport system ATPase subunit
MITSIQLRNFKGHRDTTVDLGRLTVLVGPNGSGKTSVLQALGLLHRLAWDPPEYVLRGDMDPQDLRHRQNQRPIEFFWNGMEASPPWSISLSIPVPAQDELPEQHKSPQLKWVRGEETGSDTTGPRTLLMARAIGPAMLYHFDARKIAAQAYSSEENPRVEEDGGNTAVVLAALKLEREELFEQIETELRKIVPSVQRIRLKRVKMPRRSAESSEDLVGHKIFLDFKNAPDIPAHAASEGTLITLALLTALCSPNRPRLLLLDDIDQSLHPQAQMELVRELRRLLESFPEVQLVATTHSPYILDELDPSEVRVFALRPDGSVACRGLSEHPQAQEMRGALTTGQLWSLDPEWRWVVGEG